MQYERRQQRVNAVRTDIARNLSPGEWLVGDETGATWVMSDTDFHTQFSPVGAPKETTTEAAPIIGRRTAKSETLTVPKAFPMNATSEKIVGVLTETPMSTADIAKVTKLNKSSVSRELGRLTKAHLAEQHGRGSYSLGRKAGR